MAYADTIRVPAPTMEAVATLIEGIFSSGYPLSWTSWTPTFTGGGGSWTPGSSTCKYIQCGKMILFMATAAAGAFTGTSAYVTMTLPVAKSATSTPVAGAGWLIPDTNNLRGAFIAIAASTTVINVYKYDSGNLTSGQDVSFSVFGLYEVP